MQRFDFINPNYVAYSPGDIVAYHPRRTSGEEELDPSRHFRLGEILELTFEGGEMEDEDATYRLHILGCYGESKLNTHQKRIDARHLPAYISHTLTVEERKQTYTKMFLTQQEKTETYDPVEIEVKKADFLPIPPVKLTKTGRIRPVSRHFLTSFYRVFMATRRAEAEKTRGGRKRARNLPMEEVRSSKRKKISTKSTEYVYSVTGENTRDETGRTRRAKGAPSTKYD